MYKEEVWNQSDDDVVMEFADNERNLCGENQPDPNAAVAPTEATGSDDHGLETWSADWWTWLSNLGDDDWRAWEETGELPAEPSTEPIPDKEKGFVLYVLLLILPVFVL